MTDGLSLLQKAIYDLLIADAPLMAKVTGVYDFVPDNEPYPFIQIGEISSVDRSSQTAQGFDSLANVYVWSRPEDRGRKEVRDIQYDIYRVLHMANPTITDFSVVSFRFDFSEVIVDPDAVTYHGIQRFRIRLGGN